MLDLNLAKARELIDAAIEEYGADYVYPYETCVYVLGAGDSYALNNTATTTRGVERYAEERITEPTVGCGVGVAMVKAGFKLDRLDHGGNAYDLIAELTEDGLVRSTPAACEYLNNFQARQDMEESWGTAKKFAEEKTLTSELSDKF